MAKVLSIEVGYSLTKVCEVDFKVKNPKVYNSFTIQTPEDIMEDGLIHNPDELAGKLRAELDKYGIKTKQVVYTVASSKIASRDAILPFVKENKLDELVNASAGDYFPVDLSNFKITYQMQDTVTDTDGTKQYKLAIFVAPNELLESYYVLSEKAGLTVVALDYSGNSLCAAVGDAMISGTQMVIKVDERSSVLTVFHQGKMVLQRTVPYGGEAAIDTVMEDARARGQEIPYMEALKLLRNKACIRKTLNADDAGLEADQQVLQFQMSVTESMSMLGNGILRVMDYYNSRNADKLIEEVYLTGFAENFAGLPAFMANTIGLPVRKLSELDSLSIMQGLHNAGEYISCIGAVIAPMDFIPDVHNEKKKKQLKAAARKKGTAEAGGSNESIRLVALVCGGCMLISIVLALTSVISYMSAKTQNDELKAREAELAPIELVYSEYVNVQTLNTDIRKMYESTRRQNDRLVDFLEELQVSLPYSTNVLSFSSGDWNVTMNMNVESMEAAALTVLELRKFESIATANIAAVTQEIDENTGAVSVNFTVDCTYAPVEYEMDGVEMLPGE